MMKVFVINLDKDKDRMASIDAQLRRLGVPYERISGVYAKEMPEEERSKMVNRFRWWCAIGRPVVPAEIGCALSHKKIYERMLKEGLPSVCVLEDDVKLADTFPKHLEMLESWIKGDSASVVMLSNHRKMNLARIGHSVFACSQGEIIKTNTGLCTDGYCISRDAAKSIMRQNFPMITPCDHWWRWVSDGAISLYHVSPSSVKQDQETFMSNQVDSVSECDGRKLVRNYPALRFVLHKVLRAFGLALDRVLRLILGK